MQAALSLLSKQMYNYLVSAYKSQLSGHKKALSKIKQFDFQKFRANLPIYKM